MNFELEPQYTAIQDEARALAAVVAPLAGRADPSRDLDPEVHQALKNSGLCELLVPAEFGGRSDVVDPLAISLVREILMPVSSHLDTLFAMQGIGSFAISIAGSLTQKEAWLHRVAKVDAIAALALTEPEAGSDLRKIVTVVDGSGPALVLNGRKSFISNAGVATFYTTLVRESDDTGLSLVLVPANADGVRTEWGPDLLAPHILGDVIFENVCLPPDSRIGLPGRGFDYVVATLSVFRASVGAAAVGIAEKALAIASRHANTRHQFGRPLIQHGAVATMLSESWIEIEMARLLVYRAAWLARTDPAASIVHSSMAKVAATEMATKVVDRCIQVLGRFGLIQDSEIVRLAARARPMRIYEGASEVLHFAIARDLGSRMT